MQLVCAQQEMVLQEQQTHTQSERKREGESGRPVLE